MEFIAVSAVSGRMNCGYGRVKAVAARATAAVATLAAFIRYAILRFVTDGCLTAAGALSYTTLVSLVPLTAIALAVLSAFPIFASVRDQLLADLFGNFVPEVGTEVEWWFRYFAGSAIQTTTIGILVLAVTVILLLATIEDQLHIVWRLRSQRPWLQRILAYWAILTLGPLLLGASFSLPSYVDLLAQRTGLDARALITGPWAHPVLRALPFVLEALAFTLLYELIPNCAVRWRDAIIGAVVTTVLLEGLKAAFVLYVGYLSTYRVVYGALAAIPIFLFWMYILWGAVLFGAVVAAALPVWRADERGAAAMSGAVRLGLALALLAELADQARQGGSLATTALAERLGASAAMVDDDLALLQQAGAAINTADGGWVLARSLDTISLADLYRTLGLPLARSLEEPGLYPWQRRIAPVIRRLAAAENAAFSRPVSDLLRDVVQAPMALPTPFRPRRG